MIVPLSVSPWDTSRVSFLIRNEERIIGLFFILFSAGLLLCRGRCVKKWGRVILSTQPLLEAFQIGGEPRYWCAKEK